MNQLLHWLKPATVAIPNKYQDLAEAVSEWESGVLPPHCHTDCAIEILPGVKLPKPKIYSMTPREMEELRSFLDKNLARGFTQPAKSRMTTTVLFKEKKDGSLGLCEDFQGINGVCVENMYPLLLMKDMLGYPATGRVFTKVDLREAYYSVRIK